MVRKIFLLRHGDAVIPESGMRDFERPLSSKGANHIRSLGGRMKEMSMFPDLVYCSPSLRTVQTCNHLQDAMNKELEVEFLEEIYEASVNTLFKVLCESDTLLSNVMLIGHNPGITFLAEYLTGDAVGNMVTGDLLVLEFGLGDWKALSQGTCGFRRL